MAIDPTIARTFDEYVELIAINSPAAAVLDWWCRTDRAIDGYFADRDSRRPSRWEEIDERLAQDPNVGAEGVALIRELRKIRNRVAHRGLNPSFEEAKRFAADAFRLTRPLTFQASLGDG